MIAAMLVLAIAATVWALVRRGRHLKAASLLGELALAARRSLPLAEELDGLGETLLRGDRKRTNRAAASLRNGDDLRTALRAGRLVPSSSEPALAAGEATGTLPQALADEAARLTRQSGGAVGAFWNVGFYLLVTLTVIQAVAGFILYYIVPKYQTIWEDFGVSLTEPGDGPAGWLLGIPWFESLVTVGSVTVAYWYLPLALVQLVAFALPLLAVLRQKGYRLPGGRWARRWLGTRRAHSSRVMRALANAAETDRPFPPALSAYAAAADSRGPVLTRLARRVDDGAGVGTALRQAGLLTAGEARLASAGAAAGNLPTVLRLLADRRDAAADRRRGRWLALLQPAATLLIGLLVAWFALAFFTPLIHIMNTLGQWDA